MFNALARSYRCIYLSNRSKWTIQMSILFQKLTYNFFFMAIQQKTHSVHIWKTITSQFFRFALLLLKFNKLFAFTKILIKTDTSEVAYVKLVKKQVIFVLFCSCLALIFIEYRKFVMTYHYHTSRHFFVVILSLQNQ